MTDRRRHETDYQIAGIKNSITTVASSSHITAHDGEGLQRQFSREDPPAKPTQYILLQLINMVRENPILYDEELQAKTPDSVLRTQKRESWDRIRADIVWQDITLVQEVWSDLLEQYARKSCEMSDSLVDAMRWTDSFINKKKSDSRPPSQLATISSGLDKDFYTDVPLAEDDLEPGQSIEHPEAVKFDYVVIQPSIGHSRSNSHHQIQANPLRFSRRKSLEPRETEAIVKTFPLQPKRIAPRQSKALESQQLTEVKKEANSLVYGRQTVLVDVEPSSGYTSPNKTVYKMQRSSTPQATVTVTSMRRLVQLTHRTDSLGFEPIHEHLEPSNEPPKKKIIIDHRNSSIHGSGSTTTNCIQNTKPEIITDSVPIADDEIILEADGECKIGESGLLLDPPPQSGSRNHEINQNIPSTSINHYQDPDIEESGVIEDIEQQVVVGGQSDEMAIQYDEDLAFQQHINSVLNRLSDDEKALMKFNMQRIILDARFGAGTARNLTKEDILVVEPHVEIDLNHVPNEEI